MFKTFFRNLYFWLIAPKHTDEDTSRREFILNVILCGSIFLLCLLNILVIYNTLRLGQTYEGVPWFIVTTTVLIFLTFLLLSRNGKYKIASYFSIAFYFLSITYAISMWGVDLPTALLSYAMIIVVSSILISTDFGFRITGLIAIIAIVFSYLQSKLILIPKLEWKKETLGIHDGIAFAGLFLIIMVVSWLSNREIERSLKRARRSEAALKAERDSLEIRVESRTHELRQLQLQRVTELHHFAELGKLANGFFHDLMNPLTALTLAVELFGTTRQPSTSTLTENLDKALAASRRVGEFITALRNFGTITTVAKLISLNTELRRIANLLDYTARKLRIQLELQTTQEIIININPYDLYNIAYNLLAYSIEQTKNFHTHLDKIVIIVLHRKDQQTLFEVIYPSDNLPTFAESESNLSLLITKNLLEKSGGKITAKQSKKDHLIVITAFFPQIDSA